MIQPDALQDAFQDCRLGEPETLDMAYQWEVMEYLHRPMKRPFFEYTHEYAAESVDLLIGNLRAVTLGAKGALPRNDVGIGDGVGTRDGAVRIEEFDDTATVHVKMPAKD